MKFISMIVQGDAMDAQSKLRSTIASRNESTQLFTRFRLIQRSTVTLPKSKATARIDQITLSEHDPSLGLEQEFLFNIDQINDDIARSDARELNAIDLSFQPDKHSRRPKALFTSKPEDISLSDSAGDIMLADFEVDAHQNLLNEFDAGNEFIKDIDFGEEAEIAGTLSVADQSIGGGNVTDNDLDTSLAHDFKELGLFIYYFFFAH